MLMSMTGFGRNEFKNDRREILVQIKSVNHRYRDVSIKMPRRYSFAEDAINALMKKYTQRGKIEVLINVESLCEEDANIRLDMGLAKQYYKNLRDLQKQFDVTGDITLDLLANMHDVMHATGEIENEDEFIEDMISAVEPALQRFNQMREVEGAKLEEDILARGEKLEKMLANIEERAPKVADFYEQKLKERIKDLLEDDIDIAKERIAMEVAIYADKSNIDEEITRLKSHFSQLKDIAASKEISKGKKLDFLVQELNRETNTIGSKANDIDITNTVLSMKSEVEKIREQVQNVE